MRFQPGHKLAPGGARPGAGRPPKGKKAASQIVRDIIEGNAERLSKRYLNRALGKNADRVLCHAIDKLLPDINVQAPSYSITFVKFDNDTLQLRAKEISATVLASDEGKEAGSEGVASAKRQGQNGLEFSDFEDVP